MELQTVNNLLPVTRRTIKTDSTNLRSKIMEFENILAATPGAIMGDHGYHPSFPLEHSFADRIYVRQMSIPSGAVLTGVIHKYKHPLFLLSGEIKIFTEDGGSETLKAPVSIISIAGTKRAIHAITDAILVSCHHNPDNITDVEKLVDMASAKDFSEYDDFERKRLISSNIKLIDNSKINCGLVALKKLNNLKNISARTLIDLAKDNGLILYPYKAPINKLNFVPLPAIFHSENHFSYIEKHADFDNKLKYSGYVFCTQKTNFSEIKNSELKTIHGGTMLVTGIISAAVSVTSLIVGGVKGQQASNNAVAGSSQCNQACVSKCKEDHKAIFGGRQKCINGCPDECAQAQQATPPPADTSHLIDLFGYKINVYYLAGGILLALALTFLFFRNPIKK